MAAETTRILPAHYQVVGGGTVAACFIWQVLRPVPNVISVEAQMTSNNGRALGSAFKITPGAARNTYDGPCVYVFPFFMELPYLDPQRKIATIRVVVVTVGGVRHIECNASVEVAASYTAYYGKSLAKPTLICPGSQLTAPVRASMDTFFGVGMQSMQNQVQSSFSIWSDPPELAQPIQDEIGLPLILKLCNSRVVPGGVIAGMLKFEMNRVEARVSNISVTLQHDESSNRGAKINSLQLHTGRRQAALREGTHIFFFQLLVPYQVKASKLPERYFTIRAEVNMMQPSENLIAFHAVEVLEARAPQALPCKPGPRWEIPAEARVRRAMDRWKSDQEKERRQRESSMRAVQKADALRFQPIVIEEVYENQRRMPLGSYTVQKLHKGELPFSGLNGTLVQSLESYALPDEPGWDWITDWQLDTTNTSAEGWRYSTKYHSPEWSKTNGPTQLVRCRKWIRQRKNQSKVMGYAELLEQQQAANEQLKEEFEEAINRENQQCDAHMTQYFQDVQDTMQLLEAELLLSRTLSYDILSRGSCIPLPPNMVQVVQQGRVQQPNVQEMFSANKQQLEGNVSFYNFNNRQATNASSGLPQSSHDDSGAQQQPNAVGMGVFESYDETDPMSDSISVTGTEPTSKEEDVCCICLENPKNVVLIPCSHLCMCNECADAIAQCPICRRDVTQRIKIFHA